MKITHSITSGDFIKNLSNEIAFSGNQGGLGGTEKLMKELLLSFQSGLLLTLHGSH